MDAARARLSSLNFSSVHPKRFSRNVRTQLAHSQSQSFLADLLFLSIATIDLQAYRSCSQKSSRQMQCGQSISLQPHGVRARGCMHWPQLHMLPLQTTTSCLCSSLHTANLQSQELLLSFLEFSPLSSDGQP